VVLAFTQRTQRDLREMSFLSPADSAEGAEKKWLREDKRKRVQRGIQCSLFLFERFAKEIFVFLCVNQGREKRLYNSVPKRITRTPATTHLFHQYFFIQQILYISQCRIG